jgi:hypothetical protein
MERQMAKLYSQRSSHPTDAYRYDFPDHARWRVLHTIDGLSQHGLNGFDIEGLFAEVQKALLQKYGGLYRPAYDAACAHKDPLLNHFLCCSDDMALDFIELCFRTRTGCGRQQGVEAINEVFQEEAIGYELTAWREIETAEPAKLFDRTIGSGKSYRIEYPQIVKKDEQFTHEEIVRPCLIALGHPMLQTANAEMLTAFEDYRSGKYADALTSCGSAFESVLKTICDHFGWAYNPDKDTCSKLVGICRDNGLFPPFYAPIFEATGTIRNKLGDAHGRGPAPMYAVGKEHVDHMIQMTAAHIVLLVGLAKL